MPIEPLHNEKELLRQVAEGNEKVLLLAVAQGDASAFREMFMAYRNKIYSYAMHFTDQEDVAEELVQEVFMKIWLHRDTLPQLGNFEAWVFTISRNLSFNHLRKASRQAALFRGFPDGYESAQDTADELLLHKEHVNLLRAAVSRLPPQQKLVYTLHQEQYQKLDDIAAQMGLSRSTVKNHLAQAMRSIRTYIRAYIEPGTLLALIFLPW